MLTNVTHLQHQQQRRRYQQQQQQAPEEKKKKVKGLQAAPLNQVISSLRAFQESLSLSQSCKGLQNQKYCSIFFFGPLVSKAETQYHDSQRKKRKGGIAQSSYHAYE